MWWKNGSLTCQKYFVYKFNSRFENTVPFTNLSALHARDWSCFLSAWTHTRRWIQYSIRALESWSFPFRGNRKTQLQWKLFYQTLNGQGGLSVLWCCPYYVGRVCINFVTLGPNERSVLGRCLYGEVRLYTGLQKGPGNKRKPEPKSSHSNKFIDIQVAV